MTKLVVDGIEIDVPPEYTLLQACEQAGVVDALELARRAAVLPQDLDVLGIRLEHAHDAGRMLSLAGELVIAEQRARLAVARTDECIDLDRGELLPDSHAISLAKRSFLL